MKNTEIQNETDEERAKMIEELRMLTLSQSAKRLSIASFVLSMIGFALPMSLILLFLSHKKAKVILADYPDNDDAKSSKWYCTASLILNIFYLIIWIVFAIVLITSLLTI